jgi:uncharacterized protein YndB with AHSA1/START domain
MTDLQSIVLDEFFPHAPPVIWKALTDGEMMARWMMAPTGFSPVVGKTFTFKTTPAGRWDGTISCKVLEVVAEKRLAFSWKGGDEANVGYGSKLDTIVTFTLTPAPGGARLMLVHSGFELPRNDSAYQKMGQGWKIVVAKLGDVAVDAG